MRAYLQYLGYILRHKWFVFLECCQLGIPWLGVVHDWSKFLPSEFFPYAHYFHNPDGSPKQVRDDTGYYKPDDTGNRAFDRAWFMHQKRAYHHWQSWTFPDTNGKLRVLPTPDRHRREMLADWRGAARAQGLARESVVDWYTTNKDKMILHPTTQVWIESTLGVG